MNLREKMKMCGVTLQEVANELPSANRTAVCHILNEELARSVREMAEILVTEKKVKLKETMEAM